MFRPLLAAAAAALVLAAPAKAATYDDDAYWAFADKLQQLADKHWDERNGYFHLGGSGSEPMTRWYTRTTASRLQKMLQTVVKHLPRAASRPRATRAERWS